MWRILPVALDYIAQIWDHEPHKNESMRSVDDKVSILSRLLHVAALGNHTVKSIPAND